MTRAGSAPTRLAVLMVLFSSVALGLSFGGAVLLDRDARRLRAGEAARFDMESLVEKLKGAADDPSAGPLLAAATGEIARYTGRASGRVILFVPANKRAASGATWPARLVPLKDDLLLLPDPSGEAVAVVRTLPAGRLLVAREVQADGPLRSSLVRYALITAILLLGLSGIAAWLVGRLFSARIAELNTVCNAVEAGDVAARIPAVRGNDELALLSRHLNRMLAELERRIGDLRASSDRIAHDLRTPLARLGSRLSFMADLPAEQHAAQIASAQREIGDLIEAFNGLLDLREIETESGLVRLVFPLADAVEEAIELYEAVAEDQNGITIERRLGDVTIEAVPTLITRAVANLIDNALRASPTGGTVAVVVSRDGAEALVEVRDRGAGPPATVIRALDDDLGQVSSWGGHGIGLSIVSAVVRRHAGRFDLTRDGAETVASLRFPLVPAITG
jgi:signal transduction histidine kinase